MKVVIDTGVGVRKIIEVKTLGDLPHNSEDLYELPVAKLEEAENADYVAFIKVDCNDIVWYRIWERLKGRCKMKVAIDTRAGVWKVIEIKEFLDLPYKDEELCKLPASKWEEVKDADYIVTTKIDCNGMIWYRIWER